GIVEAVRRKAGQYVLESLATSRHDRCRREHSKSQYERDKAVAEHTHPSWSRHRWEEAAKRRLLRSRYHKWQFARERLPTAFLGDNIVIAALGTRPVADQVLGVGQELRPGVARNEAVGLPHDIELAVAPDLADEDRLGDVGIGQHLRCSAGQIRGLDAGPRI